MYIPAYVTSHDDRPAVYVSHSEHGPVARARPPRSTAVTYRTRRYRARAQP